MRIVLLITALFSVALSSAQDANLGEDVVYYLKDGTVLKGTLITDGPISSEITIFNGDTILIESSLVESRYLQINNFIHLEKGRYFYESGYHIDASLSLGAGANGFHSNLDLSLNKRLNKNLSVGFGISSQLDHYFQVLQLGNEIIWLDIPHRTTPIFAQGKYFLNKKRCRFYVNARAGYSIQRNDSEQIFDGENWITPRNKNGFTTQYGIGWNKASRSGVRSFIQLNQVHTYGSGSAIARGGFNNVEVQEYNLWFNRIAFTFGLEFNLQKKNKKF